MLRVLGRYSRANSSTRRSVSARSGLACSVWPYSLRSFSSSVLSQLRSASASQRASFGVSGRYFRVGQASRTAGTPMRMNSHCQPARPAMPFMPSSAPARGPVTIRAMGCDRMKKPSTLPRWRTGYQRVM
ncbi:hypothetical protein D3C85_1221830 [compost metagenome]